MVKQNTNLGLIAIIADIVDSKKISGDKRLFYQRELKTTLEKINIKYSKEICSNFVITLGDEFQGVLNCTKPLFDIINMIQFSLEGIKIRFGIGVGKIVTDIDRAASIGSDGPAYYRARSGLIKLKKNKNNIQTIVVETNNEMFDNLINSHLYWIGKISNKWSKLQKNLIKIKTENNEITQQEIATKLGINQSIVSRSIKASSYENYLESLDSICEMVEYIRKLI